MACSCVRLNADQVIPRLGLTVAGLVTTIVAAAFFKALLRSTFHVSF